MTSVGLLWILAGCENSQCSNDAISGMPSPDAKHIAFVVRRQCGSDHRMTTEVSIVGLHNSLHNEPGNVVVVSGTPTLKVSWLDAHRLRVSGAEQPISRRDEVEGISIELR